MQPNIISRFLLNLRRASAHTHATRSSTLLTSRVSGIIFMPNAATVLGDMGERLEVGSYVEDQSEDGDDA